MTRQEAFIFIRDSNLIDTYRGAKKIIGLAIVPEGCEQHTQDTIRDRVLASSNYDGFLSTHQDFYIGLVLEWYEDGFLHQELEVVYNPL